MDKNSIIRELKKEESKIYTRDKGIVNYRIAKDGGCRMDKRTRGGKEVIEVINRIDKIQVEDWFPYSKKFFTLRFCDCYFFFDESNFNLN